MILPLTILPAANGSEPVCFMASSIVSITMFELRELGDPNGGNRSSIA
jgi:hypothetical protein